MTGGHRRRLFPDYGRVTMNDQPKPSKEGLLFSWERRVAALERQLAAMREVGRRMAEVCDFLPGREHLAAAWRKVAGEGQSGA